MSVSTEVQLCNLALSRIGANTITSLTANTAKEDRLCNQFYAQFRNEILKSFAWNFAQKSARLTLIDLYDDSETYSDAITITHVTSSNPIVVTASNNYATGYMIKIWDVGGMDEINDRNFEIGTVNAASFSLHGIDGAKFGTYSSGGKAVRQEPMSVYEMGYSYVLPWDCLKALRLDSGTEFEIFGDANARRLLTIDDDAVLIYTCQVQDVTLFPDDFVEVLVSRLARELIMPLIGTKDGAAIRKELTVDLQVALSRARRNNGHEQAMKYSFKSTWNQARK